MVVFGEATGTVTAVEEVSIGATGSVEGVILAPRVKIADGAYFQGRVVDM